MNRYSPDATSLRSDLTANGIKEPMYQGFQWSAKMNGEHIRQATAGDTTFELRIWAQGRGYGWSFNRI